MLHHMRRWQGLEQCQLLETAFVPDQDVSRFIVPYEEVSMLGAAKGAVHCRILSNAEDFALIVSNAMSEFIA